MKLTMLVVIYSLYLQAGVLEFRPRIEVMCGENNSILIKKILLGLAKHEISQSAACGPELRFLTKTCKEAIECEEIMLSYREFLLKNSSRNLIGE